MDRNFSVTVNSPVDRPQILDFRRMRLRERVNARTPLPDNGQVAAAA